MNDYKIVPTLLRKHREAAGLTQIDVAERIQDTQSYVSKCERGDRRLDVAQLRVFCRAIGIPLTDFVREFERLASRSRR
jgi:transcriptional regulator with XRE-family HTH domain